MAPLSILPGRVRYEDKRLCGNRRSIFADMALHLLLPAPFDILLPAIGPTFRREQANL